jgi:hypothetical protein
LASDALLREPYLPPGYESEDATHGGRIWVWNDPPPGVIGGYGRPETYRLAPPDSVIWKPPGEVLLPSANNTWSEEDRQTYRRHSVDLTMRGGTTSGVVYPLAVCEIAATRRIRNVGGASAGAIVAAATAAAELGRSSHLPDIEIGTLRDEDADTGRVRPGFVGLADTIAWLCQIGPTHKPHDHDEYRLAQLFRPAAPHRRVFAIATAVMRRQLWAVPVIALTAFGGLSKTILVALTFGSVALTAILGGRLSSWPMVERPGGGPGWNDWPSWGWAAFDLGLFFVVLAGALVLLPLVRTPAVDKEPPPSWLRLLSNVSSAYTQANRRRSALGRALAVSVLLLGPLVFAGMGWWHWTAGALVGAALSTLIAAVVGTSVWHYQARARGIGFGLVAGSARKSRRTVSELMAGAAKPTVTPSLMPWLSASLNQLAGLKDGQVLRFGHLWLGRDYQSRPHQPKPTRGIDDSAWQAENDSWRKKNADVLELAAKSRNRLVNLELITTDLTRQRPYRFPLDWADASDHEAEQLYFCPDDLVGPFATYFDDDVLAAMNDPNAQEYVGPDGEPRTLHRLPDPWNLPVAFAVRLSVSLPALFKAVRLYRLMSPTKVRDDLGRPVRPVGSDKPLSWPPGSVRAQELWFSDGGITSNFPVHLFDVPLPGWPTFGLNLGRHPDGHPHQDVWLPQDWQATRAPASEVRPAATAFLGAIVTTARSWRDTMQTGMPGYRGRVAWVRQRSDEGGTNLYMPREVIASLALRGALAGARLSRRFGDSTQSERYRWLRLRIALDNLQRLREELIAGRSVYDEILRGGQEYLAELERRYAYDPFSDGIDWYLPADTSFWTMARTLVVDVAGPPPKTDPTQHDPHRTRDDPGPTQEGADNVLTHGGPKPHPTLSQIPPM